jgi:hypothetical protein
MVMMATFFTTGMVPMPELPPEMEGRTTPLAAEEVGPGWAKRLDAGLEAEVIGFDWAGRSSGEVEIRVEEEGGWSEWMHVEGRPDEGPDPDSPEQNGRTAAGPIWVGRDIRDVEVRVGEGRLRDLKMHAISSESPKGPKTRSASASVSQPGIISRQQWGADESLRTVGPGCTGNPEYATNVRNAIVHHTASSNTYARSDAGDAVRAIYQFHTKTNGWCDIGYNFIVDRYGQVFEGRAGGIERAVIGAHAGGFNSGSTGVAVLGSFQDGAVPAEAYSSVRDLLSWKLALHNVPADGTVTVTSAGSSRYAAGTLVTLPAISGHRDVSATACPGDFTYRELARLRSDVRSSQGAGVIQFVYGEASDVPLMCDWDGDGIDTPGVFRDGRFYVRNSAPAVTLIHYGNPGDNPICGDWNGDSYDTIGVRRGGTWYLRNSNSTGGADVVFGYGNPVDVHVTGDWDGNGTDTPGVKRGSTWFLRNRNSTGVADVAFGYGNAGDEPVAGDWDRNGTDTIGLKRGSTWFLRNRNSTGVADLTFVFGVPADRPLGGDWDGDGLDSVGVKRGANWSLRD